jgi:hypothetical protein
MDMNLANIGWVAPPPPHEMELLAKEFAKNIWHGLSMLQEKMMGIFEPVAMAQQTGR